MNIEMVSNSLVNDYREVVQIGKCTQTWKVGSRKVYVSRKIGEKRQ